jgi:nucleotide-binding universal stress UspA family protein
MNILIFVSSQSNSKAAVLFGGLIAKKTNSIVTLLTTVDNAENLDLAYKTLDTAGWWIPDLEGHTSIQVGTESDGIFEEIYKGIYDLVVLKSNQANQLKDLLKSKIGQRVARQAPISVLVVKKIQPKLKRLLICSSGIDVADPVVEMGAWLAQCMQAQATLLHVTGEIPSMYTGLEQVEEHLPEILQTTTPMAQHLRHATEILSGKNIEAELELRHGVVSDEILLEAKSGNYDLIILGASKASSSFSGWLMGDVTQKIIKTSRSPILIVRKPIGS